MSNGVRRASTRSRMTREAARAAVALPVRAIAPMRKNSWYVTLCVAAARATTVDHKFGNRDPNWRPPFGGPSSWQPMWIASARASPGAVRVWRQGVGGDPRPQAQRRPVCALCQSAARQSLDGHTLGPVVAELKALTGIETRRIYKGYRGHNHAQKFRVWIGGQV